MPWIEDYRAGHISEDGNAVSAITRLRLAANSTILKEMTSGSAYNLAAHLVDASPIASITCLDIAEALDNLGGNGKCVTDFEMYGQRQTCGGTNPTQAVHNRYTIGQGSIVPTSMTVDHQGNAEINYDVYAASLDGLASPVAFASGIVMPPGEVAHRFEMYDVSVAGSLLEGKRNFTINWNPDVTQESSDSNLYPTVVSISSIQPTITVRGVEMGWLSNLPLDGSRGTRLDTIFRLKNRDEITSANEHVTIAADCQVSWNTLKDAGPDAPGELELQLDVFAPDESTAPLLITTGINLTP